MSDLNRMGVLFLVLAIMAACIASNARWRSKWGWGRTGQGGPISAIGWFAWILAFLVISAAGFEILPLQSIFFVVPGVMIAGVYDSWHNSR
ncbi:MAG: hypothetical protein EOM80_18060 [Erysipelotrichia bacterium]|nr:hypothetical protein [Erysipelotrichia bacterium]